MPQLSIPSTHHQNQFEENLDNSENTSSETKTNWIKIIEFSKDREKGLQIRVGTGKGKRGENETETLEKNDLREKR